MKGNIFACNWQDEKTGHKKIARNTSDHPSCPKEIHKKAADCYFGLSTITP
jgi:hypothetical protein